MQFRGKSGMNDAPASTGSVAVWNVVLFMSSTKKWRCDGILHLAFDRLTNC